MANALPPSGAIEAGGTSGEAGGTSGSSGGVTGGDTAIGSTDIFPPDFELVEVEGSAQADVLIGDADNERILGFRGNDVLFGGAGDDQLDGGIGDDRLEGGPGFDSYDGGPGTDTVTFRTGDGPAVVDLQSSNVQHAGTFEFIQEVENVTGSLYGDTLLGDDNDNVLIGGGGLDLLGGRLGDDTLDGGADGAYGTWAGSEGAVLVDLAEGRATEWDGGIDALIDIVGAVGTEHDDILRGDQGANRLEGGDGGDRLQGRGGDDVLVGGDGADSLDGGAGRDLADYSGGGPARISLASGEALDSSGARDTLTGIEDVVGSLGRDVLVGNDAANRLEGGVGADTLRGNGGADTFVFSDDLDFGDTIRDFQSGLDRLEIDAVTVANGRLAFDPATDRLTLSPEDGAAVLVAVVHGDEVASTDWVLV
jgi:Ca2+-binding RTX toxin-like protein